MTEHTFETKKTVAAMVLAGKSAYDIEKALGVHRNTVNSWKKDDEQFKQALLSVNDDWLNAQVAEAKALMPLAWKAIEGALNGADAKLRLEASKLLLSGVSIQQAVQGRLGTTKDATANAAGRIVVNVIMDQAQGVVAPVVTTAEHVECISVDVEQH